MTNTRWTTRCLFIAALALCLSRTATVVSAQVEIVHDFLRLGSNPVGGLIQGSDGAFYGVSSAGGSYVGEPGIVFRMDALGNVTMLHSFQCGSIPPLASNGCSPRAGLIQLSDGFLYGTTKTGGASDGGTVFKIATDGSGFTVLKSFQCGSIATNGCNPTATLIQASDGFLYGTTELGGANNSGTVFKIAPDGTGFAVLRSFPFNCSVVKTDGCTPRGGLIQLSDGFLYGTTAVGGANNNGTVFKIATDGSGFMLLHSFQCLVDTNGCNPAYRLMQGSDGFLYGTTTGSRNVVYKLAPDGSGFAVLKIFSCVGSSGCYPASGLVQLSDGFLYGTTSGSGTNGGGTLYKVSTDGSVFSIVKAFNCTLATEGCNPASAELLLGNDGLLYGMANQSGASSTQGIIYKVMPDGRGYLRQSILGCNAADACDPEARLIQGLDGFLYGTSRLGGTSNQGTVFKIAPDGSGLTVLKSFQCGVSTNGCDPRGGLIQLSDGSLYGMTSGGGSVSQGTLFRVMPDGSGFSVLRSFSCFVDGCFPQGELILGNDGFLYGTTSSTVFKVRPDGSGFATLKSFSCSVATPGCIPATGLLQASDGFLYGTTQYSTSTVSVAGTIFKIATDGSGYALLRSFQCGVATDGCQPLGSLIQLSDGFLYGTTAQGGASGKGTIFKISTDGTNFTILKSFSFSCLTDGCDPRGNLIQLGDGFLYGTTRTGGPDINSGVVYKIKPDGTSFALVDSFVYDGDDGINPLAGLTLANNGYVYGTTSTGGFYYAGTIFRFLAPDSIAPDTLLTSWPADPTNVTSATFTFISPEANTTFSCSLDGAAFTGCASPQTYNGLNDGAHSFQVRATDLVGNTDATPATFSWTIDIIPPDTTISASPANPTASTDASFSFFSNEAGSAFQCSLDNGGFSACVSPQSYAALAGGDHSFQVRAVDAAGNFDTTPATYNWTIDLISPDTSITASPAKATNATTATFAFTATEAGSTFVCSLDRGAFVPCTSPATYTGLAAGRHNFQVSTTDQVGNADATAAVYSWTVDLTPPDTTITSAPPAVTNLTNATFLFTSSEAGREFECSLDGGAFVACKNGQKNYPRLRLGSHTFQVRAIDIAGNVDASPASFTWTVQ